MNARRALSLLAMLAFSAAWLYAMYALGLLRIDAATSAVRARGAWVLAGGLAQATTAALGILRCWILLAMFQVHVSARRLVSATLISAAVGQFFPGGMAASELIRVGLLTGLGRRSATAVAPDVTARLVLASILDRVVGLGAMMVFGGVAALVQLFETPVHLAGAVAGVAIASLALGAAMLALPIGGRWWPRALSAWATADAAPAEAARAGFTARALERLHGLFRVWVTHGVHAAAPGKLALATLIGAATLPISCLTIWFPAHGVAVAVPFWPLVAVVPLISVATVLPLGWAGFGSQQAFTALGMAAFGVDSAAVVTASLIQNVVALLVGTLLGALAALPFMRELRELRELQREVAAQHDPAVTAGETEAAAERREE